MTPRNLSFQAHRIGNCYVLVSGFSPMSCVQKESNNTQRNNQALSTYNLLLSRPLGRLTIVVASAVANPLGRLMQ